MFTTNDSFAVGDCAVPVVHRVDELPSIAAADWEVVGDPVVPQPVRESAVSVGKA
jgi:hypothetical protein